MDSFKKIYEDFHARIVVYLTRLVGGAEAEDLAQEVFEKAAGALKDFRGASPLSTWIYRIATNTALDRLRTESFRQGLRSESLSCPAEVNAPPITVHWMGRKAPQPDQHLIRKEMNECIRDIVHNLPENYRAVIVLSELEGFKNKDIAKILQVSLETVKIRLHRARAKLRQELKAHCSFYRDERNEFACDRKAFRNKPR